ncbi:uncharacterized protein EAE98_005311 [Botrytis deweyae]|uniref:Uncharacterized protein n=1 Tax=Botrytis deweyae TaxID=2478750 RepID=A0ABQ7INI2_9HELO|nr:uncharacterized protein EAE98_005311 [Botrytis deweyae]KAF7929393.1 hypothetical protein EAE98_005311 [Botrytis deweyae]
MPSANAERRRPEQKSSNGLDGEHARNQAGVLELDYGSPARSTQFPNLSKGSDTEMEETRDDIDEAMRRRHVANEETDEIVEKLKKNVDTFIKKISALEGLLRDEKAMVEKLQTDMAEKTGEHQTIQGFMSIASQRAQKEIHEKVQLEEKIIKQKTEINDLTAARQDLQRRLNEANRKLSVEVENGKNLQSKFTAEIAKTHLLREEKHTLGEELEDKKKLLDKLRGWFRTIKACANDKTLDSYLA